MSNTNHTTPEQRPQQQPQPPEEIVRDGKLKAAIWRQQGERGDYFTARFAKLYTDQDGAIQETQNFTKNDLLALAELARKTYSRVSEITREDYRRRQAQVEHQGERQTHKQTL